jgi:hybrid cluster-associated redox disulfide protein
MTKEKQKITKETNILDAMNINPDAIEILSQLGLGCIGCSLAHAETLEQGLNAHGFSEKEMNEIIEKLNK